MTNQSASTERDGTTDRVSQAPEVAISSATIQGIYSDAGAYKAATTAHDVGDVSTLLGNLNISEQTKINQVGADKAVMAADANLPPLTLPELKTEGAKLFDRLDPGHSGVISTAAMARALEDPSITGQEAKALATLYGLKERERSNSEEREKAAKQPQASSDTNAPKVPLPDAEHLTRAELANLPDSRVEEVGRASFLRELNAPGSLATLDQNNAGRLSSADLKAAGGMTAAFADTYDSMVKDFLSKNPNLPDAAEISKKGLNAAELDQLGQMQNERAGESGTLQFRLDKANQRSLDFGSNRLFENVADPLKSIKMDDVCQGIAGDCYFDAALADVARLQPQIIRDSITANQNGSYTVKFKGDPEHPITVAAPTEAELELFNGSTKDGIWANVMEKAFADHKILFGGRHAQGNSPEEAASGGSALETLRLLTGNTGIAREIIHQRQALDPNYQYPQRVAEAESFLQQSLAANGYAIVGTEGSKDVEKYNLEPAHEYTVLGFQPGANGGTYKLRNPHGDRSRPGQDYLSVSGNDLALSMDEVNVAKLQ